MMKRELFYLVVLSFATQSHTSTTTTTYHSRSIAGSSARFNEFASFCLEKQQEIIKELECEDGKSTFQQDPWSKENLDQNQSTNLRLQGHGVTAVLQRGSAFEKAAVSTTITSGTLTIERAKAISSRSNIDISRLIDTKYYASALSLVLHSRSPMVPTFRADVRYFELADGTGWFGGGGDLTPYYLFDEDAKSFHTAYKQVCDQYHSKLYNKLKPWCDRYFYIPAREEHRGIGGIFFDDLSSIDPSPVDSNNNSNNKKEINIAEAMKFTCDVCRSFMPSYLPIVRLRKDLPYSDEQRHWQLLRRGRYIEFNMLYDRGVKFGLVPGGRTEAVLVSCPPLVAWDYQHTPTVGSEEARLMEILKNPKEWI
jgi:coproporphyrinogen III oxidase